MSASFDILEDTKLPSVVRAMRENGPWPLDSLCRCNPLASVWAGAARRSLTVGSQLGGDHTDRIRPAPRGAREHPARACERARGERRLSPRRRGDLVPRTPEPQHPHLWLRRRIRRTVGCIHRGRNCPRRLRPRSHDKAARQPPAGRARGQRAPCRVPGRDGLVSSLPSAASGYRNYVKERYEGGAAWTRIVGEPVWTGHSDTELAEWFRYEALINLSFASSPATVVCTYDTRSTPESALDEAFRTHPQVGAGQVTASATYRQPEDFLLPLT